jgi:hypothetical protein
VSITCIFTLQRISPLGSVIDVGAPKGFLEPMTGFAPTFEALWEGKAAVCQTTNKEFNLPRPSVVIVDVSSL